jgi:hypothetical protein
MPGAFNSKGVAVVVVVVLLHTRASAQQDGDLQQQLQELKQQYEQTTKDLQQRIAVLEQQIQKQNEAAAQRKEAANSSEATVSAAELAAENAVRKVLFGNSDQVGAQYQGQVPSVPTYDQLREAETKIAGLQQQLGAFEFHGYLRSGYGLNSEGGQQVAFGSFVVNYFGRPEIAGLSAKTAAGYVSFYWAGAMIGRFLGAGLLRKFRAGHLLGAFAICTSSLVSLSMLTHGHFAMWSILAVGFFNSIMFPTIFSLGVAELGPLTGNGSGILNMAIVGGAIVPLIQGAIADHIGLHHAFFIPVICYLYILYYALSGSKSNSERYATA